MRDAADEPRCVLTGQLCGHHFDFFLFLTDVCELL